MKSDICIELHALLILGNYGVHLTQKQMGELIMTEGHYVFKTGISVNSFKIIFISYYVITELE